MAKCLQRRLEPALSDLGLARLASPSLGPCTVRQLDLTRQKGVNSNVISRSISPQRFPGASGTPWNSAESVIIFYAQNADLCYVAAWKRACCEYICWACVSFCVHAAS